VDSPLVSVITSISLEHTQQLGDTLAKIAFEKAGIIKAKCPVVIGAMPPEAKAVFLEKVTSLASPITWVEPATPLENAWVMAGEVKYPLALLGEFQLMNSAVAIAAIQVLQAQGWQISLEAIQAGMEQTQWRGRVQWLEYQGKKLLIDGAHNPAAAIVLRQYVDSLTTKPVNWVMGILSTKDHQGIFRALLSPGDRLYLVPVPDHSSADPQELAILAQSICPELAVCLVYGDVHQALEQSLPQPELTILCGSLYLVGYFLTLSQTTAIPLGR
jgi:dihydrofolate synthase/folylpolyglutamate synthase